MSHPKCELTQSSVPRDLDSSRSLHTFEGSRVHKDKGFTVKVFPNICMQNL